MVIAQIQKMVQKQLRKYLKPEKRIATEALIRLFHFADYVLPETIKEKITEHCDELVDCYCTWRKTDGDKDIMEIYYEAEPLTHGYLHGLINVMLGEWLMGDVYNHGKLSYLFDMIRDYALDFVFEADCYIVLKQCPQWFAKYYDYFPDINEAELKTNANIHRGLHPELFIGLLKERITNQGINCYFSHNGMWYNSKTETIISNALDSEDCLYFPNAGVRINRLNNAGVKLEKINKQVDFLVCHNGNWGILECDGGIHHTSAAKDHARDDMFNAHKFWFIRRYPASQCYEKPNETVRHFLKRMEEFYANRK
jgi:very-short-patch-repair endonuclease